MELAEKIRRIQAELGKPCSVNQCGPGVIIPEDPIQDLGDTVLIHVLVDANALEIKAGEHENFAWEQAYFVVFNRPSFNDDPISVQAKSIYDNWTKKGFAKNAHSPHPVEQALHYLNLVMMAPGSYGAKSCFERAKILILAHCSVGQGAKEA